MPVKYYPFFYKKTEVDIDLLRFSHVLICLLDIRLKVGELDGVDVLLRALSVSRCLLCYQGAYALNRSIDAKTLLLRMNQKWLKTFSTPCALF